MAATPKSITELVQTFEDCKDAGLRLPTGLDLSPSGGPSVGASDGGSRVALSWSMAGFLIRSVAWGWLGCPEIMAGSKRKPLDKPAVILLEPGPDLELNAVDGDTIDHALQAACRKKCEAEAYK